MPSRRSAHCQTNSDAWLAVDLAIVELHSVIHFMHSESCPVGAAQHSRRCACGRAGLHFIKIFQEALSNVLQHAHATRLIVELTCPPPQGVLLLRIADNGRGIGARGSNARGRGLGGMSRRAAAPGAGGKVIQALERDAPACICQNPGGGTQFGIMDRPPQPVFLGQRSFAVRSQGIGLG
jgi:hypothetical protein